MQSAMILTIAAAIIFFSASTEAKATRMPCFVGNEDYHHVKYGFSYCKGVYTLNEESIHLSGAKDDLGIDAFVLENGEDEDDDFYEANRSVCEIEVDQKSGEFRAVCRCWKPRCNIAMSPKELFESGNFNLRADRMKKKN